MYCRCRYISIYLCKCIMLFGWHFTWSAPIISGITHSFRNIMEILFGNFILKNICISPLQRFKILRRYFSRAGYYIRISQGVYVCVWLHLRVMRINDTNLCNFSMEAVFIKIKASPTYLFNIYLLRVYTWFSLNS